MTITAAINVVTIPDLKIIRPYSSVILSSVLVFKGCKTALFIMYYMYIISLKLYCVPKNFTCVACYNFHKMNRF